MGWLWRTKECYRINRQWGDSRFAAFVYAIQWKRFPEVLPNFPEEE